MSRWLTSIVVLAVAVAPLAVGSVHRELQAALFVVIGLALAAEALTDERRPWLLPVPVLGIAAVVLGMVVLQSLPMPPWLAGLLSPAAADAQRFLAASPGQPAPEAAWQPLSMAPLEARLAAARLVAYLALFLLVVRRFRGQRRSGALLMTIAVVGGASCVVGLLQTMVGADSVLGIYTPREGSAYPFMATFVNPNFQATFLGMAGLVTLGLAQEPGRLSVRRSALYAVAVACFVMVYLTLCRATMILLPLAVALFWVLSRGRGRRPAVGVALVFVAWLGLAVFVASDAMLVQLASLLPESPVRDLTKPDLWAAVPSMLRDYWTVGVGPGAFPFVFPHYAPELCRRYLFLGAESLPLQLLVDYGVPAALLVCAAVGLFARATLARTPSEPAAHGVAAALAFVALHNLVDYSLSAPGVAIPATVLAAWPWARMARHRPRGADREVGLRRLSSAAVLGLAALAVGSGLLLWVHQDDTVRGMADSLRAAAVAEQTSDVAFEAEFERARRAQPANYHLYLLRAERLLRRSAKPATVAGEGIHWVNRALFLHPGNAAAHEVAARFLLAAGRRGQALDEYRRAAAGAATPAARIAIVERLHARGATVAETVAVVGEDREAQGHALRAYLGMHRPDLALAALDSMGYAQATSDDANAQFLVATVLQRAGEDERLARHVEQTAGRFEGDGRSWLWSGRVVRAAGREDEALRLIQTGLARTTHPGITDGLAREATALLADRGDLEALAALSTRPRVGPMVRAEVLYRMGKIQASRGQVSEAMRALRLARRYRTGWVPPALTIAELWEKADNPSLAALIYEEVLAMDPQNDEAAAGLARVRRALEVRELGRAIRTPPPPAPDAP